MKYKYTFKTCPNYIVGATNMLLAVSEYGPVTFTQKSLIVNTGKITAYEYSYITGMWDKIVGSVKTHNVKPPVLDVDDLYVDNALFFTVANGDKKEYYRMRREQDCFPIINRGQLWYNHLTLAQKSELNDWYEAWLDITHTFVIPTAPSWLNNTLNKIEPEELL